MSRVNRLNLASVLLLSLVITNIIFAAEIVVDRADSAQAAQLGQTSKSIPQIDIVNPQHGISHNRFKEYNVGKSGVVINNNRYSGTVDGLGHVSANPHLSESAETVLFEVTGNGRSLLNGISTIVGDQARFILANPNGITCNGCGFVNSHEVELRTDKLLSVAGGKIDWEANSQGDIYVGKKGIVVSDGSLLLSSGTIRINGLTKAKDILKVEARRAVNGNGLSTNKDSSADVYAIDVSTITPVAAGGIYLVATGKGAGVRISTPRAIIDENVQSEEVVRSTQGSIFVEAQGQGKY